MTTFSKIVIAGALLASMSFAQQADPFREERLTGQSLLIFQVGSIDGVWQ